MEVASIVNGFQRSERSVRVAKQSGRQIIACLPPILRRSVHTCQGINIAKAGKQVDLLLRDDLSLSVALNVSCEGLRLEVQTP